MGSELSGIIKSVEVDYNDRVKVGQVLARLDTSKLEAQVTQSKAALESAKAKVLQTQATVKETRSKLAQLKKVWEMSNKKVPSQSELDAAEAALDRAEADEASARAAVSQAAGQLSKPMRRTCPSRSSVRPINGIVLTRSVEPGQTVAASFTTPVLFTLADDLTKMELHVNVDEADVGKIKEGQKAAFTVAAYPNRTFEARITQARYGSSTDLRGGDLRNRVKGQQLGSVPAARDDGHRGHHGQKGRKSHPYPQRRPAFYPAGAGGEKGFRRSGRQPPSPPAPAKISNSSMTQPRTNPSSRSMY